MYRVFKVSQDCILPLRNYFGCIGNKNGESHDMEPGVCSDMCHMGLKVT